MKLYSRIDSDSSGLSRETIRLTEIVLLLRVDGRRILRPKHTGNATYCTAFTAYSSILNRTFTNNCNWLFTSELIGILRVIVKS